MNQSNEDIKREDEEERKVLKVAQVLLELMSIPENVLEDESSPKVWIQ